jgi:hypothetical protein
LRGKDLACVCPLTVPCHADLLLQALAATMEVCMSAESPPDAPAVLARLRADRAAVQAQYRALCADIGHAAVHDPGALPDLLAMLKARFDARTALDFVIASYDPQQGLFDAYH